MSTVLQMALMKEEMMENQMGSMLVLMKVSQMETLLAEQMVYQTVA
jgi:hypothetical protein